MFPVKLLLLKSLHSSINPETLVLNCMQIFVMHPRLQLSYIASVLIVQEKHGFSDWWSFFILHLKNFIHFQLFMSLRDGTYFIRSWKYWKAYNTSKLVRPLKSGRVPVNPQLRKLLQISMSTQLIICISYILHVDYEGILAADPVLLNQYLIYF